MKEKIILNPIDQKIYIPATVETKTIKQFLHSPTRMKSPRRGQIKYREHYITKDLLIDYKGENEEFTLSIEKSKELFAKRIPNSVKILNFILQKLNEQHFPERTTFLLKELVNNKIYSNKDSAFKGLSNILEKMYHISIEGQKTIYENKKKPKIIQKGKTRIISGYNITYNQCYIEISSFIREDINSFTTLPEWSYRIKNENSYMLIDYIFYLLRVRKQKTINIKLETIRQYLGLPDPANTSHHKQLIIDKIDQALEEIEETQKESENIELTFIEVHKFNYTNIYEYLNGFLKVTYYKNIFPLNERNNTRKKQNL